MRFALLVLATTLLLSSASGSLAQNATEDTAITQDPLIPAPVDPAGRAAVAGINRFTLDLYKRIGEQTDNLFLSPASVSTAMALAYSGARGTTADELRRVLYYSAPPETYLAAQASLSRAMTFAAAGRELSTKNSLWVQEGVGIDGAYLANVESNASAGLQSVDYRADPDRARLAINKWVEDATRNRIRDLLSPSTVTSNTRAILVNTIYWKANWATAFSPGATKTKAFHFLNGTTAQTPLMNNLASYQMLARAGSKAINLPYRGGEVTMTVLMPDKANGLPDFETKLTNASLTKWLTDLDAVPFRSTQLAFPKMHLEWKSDLVPTLESLGIQEAFGQKADFTGMAKLNEPGVLAIGAIIHQTWLDLDEKGSEAAAATAVVDVIITGLRRDPPPPPPLVFRADKPFLFLLRDRRTGMILFIGRYIGPEPKVA